MSDDVILMFNADNRQAEIAQQQFINIAFDNKENLTLNKKEKMIISEIFLTEVSYILQLEILIKFFLLPLSRNHLMEQTKFDSVFSNILQLYNINKELIIAIQGGSSHISQTFITFAPYLKLYSIYAYGYKKGMEVLEKVLNEDKSLKRFIKSQETRPEVGATLISLLIAPIQRVPRYRLLLRSLLEASDDQSDQVLQIKEALDGIEETADHINRLITESEEGEQLVKLSKRLPSRKGESIVIPGRKVIKQGIVRKTSKGLGSCQRYMVLFNDSILICKGNSTGPLNSSILLPLRHVVIEPALGSAVFRVTCKERDLLLYTSNPQDGEMWINAIREAILNHVQCRKTLRKESSKASMCRRRVSRTSMSSILIQQARKVCRKVGLAKLKRLKDNGRRRGH